MKSADIDGNGSPDVTFEFNALGRRVARTQGSDAVVYYQVDQQTIADYPRGGAATSPTYRYFWASYIDELIARKATGSGGELLFAHRNQQYSILSLSDSSGAVVERISYTAYGQPTFTNAAGTTLSSSAKATRYSYTGREWDPSLELHNFRARWMSGVNGRFLGRDPIGFVARDWNVYKFVYSAPLSFLDPTGLQTMQLVSGGRNEAPEAKSIANKCACCCCPVSVTATATVTNKSTGREYAQSVDITFSVEMEYKKAPANATSTSCEMALLEFIDPVSTDHLSPFMYPDTWFDYTRFPEKEWIDHVNRRPKIFDSWRDFSSVESKACKGKSTWSGTDHSQQPSIKPGETMNFWQLVGVRGGGDCKCKPLTRAVLTNVVYDPQKGNGDPTFNSYQLPLQRGIGLPDGLLPLPKFPMK